MKSLLRHDVSSVLEGHILGSVREGDVGEDTVEGHPACTQARMEVRKQADRAALVADVVQHSRLMTDMRERGDDNKNHILHAVAHCLSSSCGNAGHLLRWFPVRFRRISNHRFQQLLRVQFGVPAILPLSGRCNCNPRGLRREDNVLGRAERVLGEHDGWEEAERVRMENEPLHALSCSLRKGQATMRHDQVCETLRGMFQNLLSRVQVTRERVLVETYQPDRRTDLTVSHGAKKWELDVRLTTPATPSRLRRLHTDVLPGRAGEAAFRSKLVNYQPLVGQLDGELVPFVVETGGRIHPASAAFVVDLVSRSVRERASSTSGMDESDIVSEIRSLCQRIFNRVGVVVMRSVGRCIAEHVDDLAAVRKRDLEQYQQQHQRDGEEFD